MAAPLSGPVSQATSIERAIDRWASFGALALAIVVAVVFLFLR